MAAVKLGERLWLGGVASRYVTTETYTHRTSKMFLEDMELEIKFRKKISVLYGG